MILRLELDRLTAARLKSVAAQQGLETRGVEVAGSFSESFRENELTGSSNREC